MQNTEETFVCERKLYEKTFKKENIGNIKNFIQEQALKDGFKIVLPTGVKENYIYFICNRGGKSKKPEGDGKRAKPSKKIGKNFFIILSLSIRMPFSTFIYLQR